jgi:hypothetical protein
MFELWIGYRKGSRGDGPEYACIRGEARDRDADVIVDAEHLLLVRRELSARALDTEEQGERHGMRGTRQREANATPRTATATCRWCLRAGQGRAGQGRAGQGIVMARTLRARRMAWVLERKPTAAEPCLTASRAYSTWCNRPWGEKTVLSES